MMSRCPTMTFSTSARNRSKAATNSWTRASCVIVLSFRAPSRYYSKQAHDHSWSPRNVAEFRAGQCGGEARRSFLKPRGPSSSFSLTGHEQVDRERSPAPGSDDDRVHVERSQAVAQHSSQPADGHDRVEQGRHVGGG